MEEYGIMLGTIYLSINQSAYWIYVLRKMSKFAFKINFQ